MNDRTFLVGFGAVITASRAGRIVVVAAALLALVLVVPFGWRVALAAWGPGAEDRQPSYLPTLERSRAREPFEAVVVDDLARLDPGIVVIGDSMAGRIDPDRLAALSHRAVGPILHNATGSAYWYLALKNFVVASGVRPDWVLVFFRDTNLTDVTFRLDGPYRSALDQAAHDREDELDAVVSRRRRGNWHAVHDAANRIYDVARAREWVEPALSRWPARLVAGDDAGRLLERVNDAFALERLRPMAQADLAAADLQQADVDRFVEASVLPLMLDLARAHDLRLVFVRVLRRPEHGQPPAEAPQMRQYVTQLRAYIEARGGFLLDDRDVPALAQLPYADGDHVARDARGPYTDLLWERLQDLERTTR